MKMLEDYSIISAIVFLTLGFLMCFGGYKLYKDLMTVFTVIITIILGFYLYMAYVEKNSAYNTKIWLILLVLLVVVVLFAVLIMFSNVVYFLLAFLISYKLGLILHTYL